MPKTENNRKWRIYFMRTLRKSFQEIRRKITNKFYLAMMAITTGGLFFPQSALAGTKDGAKDTAVDPGVVANNAAGVVTYIASAFAAGIGMYVLVGGIQEFSQARESHDTSTQMKAVSKIMAGALAALAGGIAAWMKSQTK